MGTIKVGKRQFRWGWEQKRHKARKNLTKPLSGAPTARFVEAAPAEQPNGVIVSWSSGDSRASAWVPYTVEYKAGLLARWRNAGQSQHHAGRYLISGLNPARKYRFRVMASGRGPELGRDLAALADA